jgi:hypothetical protein
VTRWGATLAGLHKDDIGSDGNLIITTDVTNVEMSAAAASVIHEPDPSSRNEPLENSDQ